MSIGEIQLGEGLLEFVDNSPMAFFAVKKIENQLKKAGYKELSEGDKWSLSSSGRYYIKRNDSSLAAFETGKYKPWETGFKIAGAHTDSPILKIKNDSMEKSAGCYKINVEPYGGGIISTWLDRDLSIAGKVITRDGNLFKSTLIDFKRAVGIIPNLAIHLNRDVNKGFEYNKQDHLSVLLTGSDNADNLTLSQIIGDEFGFDVNTIIEMDLYFYDIQKGTFSGLNRDLITAGRLDNLAMCHGILTSLVDSTPSDSTKIAVFFDNEEIGSRTLQGADSNFMPSLIDRIVFSLGGGYEECQIARYKSFLISADGAHGKHPNFPSKHDSSYSPLLNHGPVIKYNANFRYATTSESSAEFIKLCIDSDVPYQKLVNRSDIPSGSTIGPTTTAILGIKGVDVGNPMLAMHSIRETQGLKDHYYMYKILKNFFSC